MLQHSSSSNSTRETKGNNFPQNRHRAPLIHPVIKTKYSPIVASRLVYVRLTFLLANPPPLAPPQYNDNLDKLDGDVVACAIILTCTVYQRPIFGNSREYSVIFGNLIIARDTGVRCCCCCHFAPALPSISIHPVPLDVAAGLGHYNICPVCHVVGQVLLAI